MFSVSFIPKIASSDKKVMVNMFVTSYKLHATIHKQVKLEKRGERARTSVWMEKRLSANPPSLLLHSSSFLFLVGCLWLVPLSFPSFSVAVG